MKLRNERPIFSLVDSCEIFHVNVQMHTYRSGMVTGVNMCVSGIHHLHTHPACRNTHRHPPLTRIRFTASPCQVTHVNLCLTEVRSVLDECRPCACQKPKKLDVPVLGLGLGTGPCDLIGQLLPSSSQNLAWFPAFGTLCKQIRTGSR